MVVIVIRVLQSRGGTKVSCSRFKIISFNSIIDIGLYFAHEDDIRVERVHLNSQVGGAADCFNHGCVHSLYGRRRGQVRVRT